MTDIRERLADALREHTPVDTSGGSETERNLIFCGGHQWHTEHEGWQSWVDHVADVLLSLPGIAIVQLQEPERSSEEVGLFLSRDGTAVNMYGDYFDQTPAEIRAHAAALLAAANAAEAVEVPYVHDEEMVENKI